jgi:hypothetical protein
VRNEYSEPLYLLYKDGRNCCDEFEKVVNFLVEDESGIDQFEKGLQGDYLGISLPEIPSYKQTNIRDFKDRSLKKSYDFIKGYHDEWRDKVVAILNKIPQISFRMRFDEPKGELGAFSRINYDFTKDMEEFLDVYDSFEAEVSELFSIINDYEKSIYQPSDFAPKQELKEEAKDIIYHLRYDEIQGKLYLNDTEVYKSNLGSKLDKALSDAFKAPETTVKTVGSVASALDAIKMPKSLKRLAFRASKGSFVAKTEITADDLKNANLDKETLDLEIQKLSK